MLYVYPTDTVWGIGGDIYSDDDYKQIAAIKNRDKSKPLSVLFHDINQVREWFNLPFSNNWLESFFSLESTLLVPSSWLKNGVTNIPFSGNYWGVRVLPLFTKPITTTSLNVSGQDPIVNYEEAKEFFNKYCNQFDLKLLNFDITPSGYESTIMQADILEFVREGRFLSQINELLLIYYKTSSKEEDTL